MKTNSSSTLVALALFTAQAGTGCDCGVPRRLKLFA